MGYLFLGKKGFMGIGTLIVFIASIIVAAVAAGTIIRTQLVLQNRAYDVGSEARKSVDMNFKTAKLRIKYDTTENIYDEMEAIITLGIGSKDAKINRTLVEFVSSNISTMLNYGGPSSNTSYFTNKANRTIYEVGDSWQRMKTDLDGDLHEDYIRILNESYISLNISSLGILNYSAPSLENSTSLNTSIDITYNSSSYGLLWLVGNVVSNQSLDHVKVQPLDHLVGFGIYTMEFLRKNPKNNYDDRLFEGDVVKIYFELADRLSEDEEYIFAVKKPRAQIWRIHTVAPNSFLTSHIDLR